MAWGSVAVAAPAEHADHGHILVLAVDVVPGTFPPVPMSAGGCIDLANGRPVPETAHHDQLHAGLDGGDFTARTGHIVIPTFPYVTPTGETVPWKNCDEFLAFFGIE